MAAIPVTSVSLIRTLADNPQSARWAELYRLYEEPMRGFLQTRFPSVEADDAIQETMAALTRVLPDYHRTPDEKRHFRNYLMGILEHKAADLLKRQSRESNARAALHDEPPADEGAAEDREWRFAAMEAAVEQLMSDPTINARTREVFRHVALQHEPAEAVALQFGITRNNVDQIKKRLIGKLADLIRLMTETV